MPEQKGFEISRRDLSFKVIPATILGFLGAGVLIKGAEWIGKAAIRASIAENLNEASKFAAELDIRARTEKIDSRLQRMGFTASTPGQIFLRNKIDELVKIGGYLEKGESGYEYMVLDGISQTKSYFSGETAKEYRQEFGKTSLLVKGTDSSGKKEIERKPDLSPAKEKVLRKVVETILGPSQGALLQKLVLRSNPDFHLTADEVAYAERVKKTITLQNWEAPFLLVQIVVPHECAHLFVEYYWSHDAFPPIYSAMSPRMLIRTLEYLPEIIGEIVDNRIDYGYYNLKRLNDALKKLTADQAGGFENRELILEKFAPLFANNEINSRNLADYFTLYKNLEGKLKGTYIGNFIEDKLLASCDEIFAQSLPLSILNTLPASSPRYQMIREILSDLNPDQPPDMIFSSLRQLMAEDLETSLHLFPDEAKEFLRKLVRGYLIPEEAISDNETREKRGKYQSLFNFIDNPQLYYAIYHFPEPGLRDKIFSAILGQDEWNNRLVVK